MNLSKQSHQPKIMSGTFSAPRNGVISNTKSIKVISDRPSPMKDVNNNKSIKTNPSFLLDDQVLAQGISREEVLKISDRKDSLNFNDSQDVPFVVMNKT